MNKIPSDYQAARELYDAFVELGRERGEQSAGRDSSRRRRGRSRRVLMLTVLTLLGLGGVAAATQVIFDDGAPVKDERQLPAHLRRAPADAALADARVRDPRGALPWGERLYSSAAGGRCALVGRVKHGNLGVLRGHRFSAFGRNAPGTCARRGAHMLIARQDYGPTSGQRSVLFGFVDRSVTAIAIVAGQRRDSVRIAPDGSFLFVTVPKIEGTLVVSTARGQVRRKLGS